MDPLFWIIGGVVVLVACFALSFAGKDQPPNVGLPPAPSGGLFSARADVFLSEQSALVDDFNRARRRAEAWEFWDWCNAVAIAAAEAAYDGPAFKLWRDRHGMFQLQAYKGHASPIYVEDINTMPLAEPNCRAVWEYLGPKGGFPSEAMAMDFLNAYLASPDVLRELDKDGHVMVMASRPGEIFLG